MKLKHVLLVPLCLALSLPLAAQVTLKPGDPAPALKIRKWVQGVPIAKIEKGQIYVFEFWATWCGPCIANMPHLSEIARKFEGKVKVTGVDVWEANHDKVTDPVRLVLDFMKKNPGRMSYNVCVDDGEYMGDNWLKAAGQEGIPCSFIIDKDGRIAWIGHPYYMEPILEKVVAGNFDLASYSAEQKAKREAEEAADVPNRAIIKPVDDALSAKNYREVLRLAAEVEKDHPDLALRVVVQKYKALVAIKDDKGIQGVFLKSLSAPKPDGMAPILVLDAIEVKGLQKQTFMLMGRYAEDLLARTPGAKAVDILHLAARAYLYAEEFDKACAVIQRAIDIGKKEKLLDSQIKPLVDFQNKCKAAKSSKGRGRLN